MTFTMGPLLGVAVTVWLLLTIGCLIRVFQLEAQIPRLWNSLMDLDEQLIGQLNSITELKERIDELELLGTLDGPEPDGRQDS